MLNRHSHIASQTQGSDRLERETTTHTTHMLSSKPTARRANEGTTGRDDRIISACDSSLVSEQTVL